MKFSVKIPAYWIFLLGMGLFGQLNAQTMDTIRVNYNQLLILHDTVYFGIQDSLVVLPDSAYYSIKKNWFVRDSMYYIENPEKKENVNYLYSEYEKFIRSQAVKEESPPIENFNASDDYFKPYSNMVISSIKYAEVELFEGDVRDTSIHSVSGYSKALNNIHIDTRSWVLKSNVQFKKGDEVMPRIISDNERLIRNLPYIEDAKIYMQVVDTAPNKVDVLIVTKDKFPFGVGGSVYNYNYFKVEPYTRNLGGLGHTLGGSILFRGDKDPSFGWGANYGIDNIWRTFTHFKMEYVNNYKQEMAMAQLEKPFLTTNTRLGGELTFVQLTQERGTKFYTPDSVFETKNDFTLRYLDSYLGVSIFLSKDLTKPHLNLAGRFLQEDYLRRPEIRPDTNFSFHDRKLLLGSIMVRKISYLKTIKLVGFGKIEDVPTGFTLKLTGGNLKTNYFNRYYASISAFYSHLINKSQLIVATAGAGGFKHNTVYSDAVIGAKVTYFGPLLPINRFELRNAFSVSYNSLVNPLYYVPLNFGNQIRGLKQSEIYGESALTLRYQPIFFSPYRLIGFKLSFNPYVDMGWISLSQNLFGDNQFFVVYGLAASIKNESFTFPAMNVSVGYYPHWVDAKYKLRFDITFRDYRILEMFTKPKPEILKPSDFY